VKRLVLPFTLSLAAAGCLSTDPTRVVEELHEVRQKTSTDWLVQAGREAEPQQAETERPPKFDAAISLEEAVAVALQHNLALRAMQRRSDEVRGIVEEARSGALPALVTGASVVSDLSERGDAPETYAITARLTQPLWRSGIVAAGLRYARLQAADTDAAIRQKTQATIAATARHYLDTLLQHHLTTVYEESVGVAERMLHTSRAKRDAGTASEYEVLRAEVEVSTANADLLRARNTLRTSMMELRRTLGISQESEIELTDSLDFEAETCDLRQAVGLALEHRPDLFRAEATLRMAEAQTAAVRGQYGPVADAFLGVNYANPNPNRRPGSQVDKSWGDDWSIGATLSWTLFDGFERRGKLRQVLSKRDQAEVALRDAEEAARVEVVKALLDLNHAAELYTSQRKNIDQAREALRMIESGFRMGRNTQVEVLDAQSALTEAMGRYHNSVHQHSLARLDLLHAIGLLGPRALEPITPLFEHHEELEQN